MSSWRPSFIGVLKWMVEFGLIDIFPTYIIITVDGQKFQRQDWSSSTPYEFKKPEELLLNMPPPRLGHVVIIRTFVDADHAGESSV